MTNGDTMTRLEEARNAVAEARMKLAEAEAALEDALQRQDMPREPEHDVTLTIEIVLQFSPANDWRRVFIHYDHKNKVWRVVGPGVNQAHDWAGLIGFLDQQRRASLMTYLTSDGEFLVNGAPFRIGARA